MITTEEYHQLKSEWNSLQKELDDTMKDLHRLRKLEANYAVEREQLRLASASLQKELAKCSADRPLPASLLAEAEAAKQALAYGKRLLAEAEAEAAAPIDVSNAITDDAELDAYLQTVFPRGCAVYLHPAAPAPAGTPDGWAWRLVPGYVESHRNGGRLMVRFPNMSSAVSVAHHQLRPGPRPGDRVVLDSRVDTPVHGWIPRIGRSDEGSVIALENAFARVYFPYADDARDSDGAVRELHVRELRPAPRARLARGEIVFVTDEAAAAAPPLPAAPEENEGCLRDIHGRPGLVVAAGDMYDTIDATVSVDFGTLGRYEVPAGALVAPFGVGTLVVCADRPVEAAEPVLATLQPVMPVPVPQIPNGANVPLLVSPGQVLSREVGAVLGVAEGVVYVVFASTGRIACHPESLAPAPAPAVSSAALQRGDYIIVPPRSAPPFVGLDSPVIVDRAVSAAAAASSRPRIEVIVAVGARTGLCRWALDPAATLTLLHGPGSSVTPRDLVTCADGDVGEASRVERRPNGTVVVSYLCSDGNTRDVPASQCSVRAASVAHPIISLLSRVALRSGAETRVSTWPKGRAGLLRGIDSGGFSCVEFEPSEPGAPPAYLWVRSKLLVEVETGVPMSHLRSPCRPGLLSPPPVKFNTPEPSLIEADDDQTHAGRAAAGSAAPSEEVFTNPDWDY